MVIACSSCVWVPDEIGVSAALQSGFAEIYIFISALFCQVITEFC
jgi:hypothetical protein